MRRHQRNYFLIGLSEIDIVAPTNDPLNLVN